MIFCFCKCWCDPLRNQWAAEVAAILGQRVIGFNNTIGEPLKVAWCFLKHASHLNETIQLQDKCWHRREQHVARLFELFDSFRFVLSSLISQFFKSKKLWTMLIFNVHQLACYSLYEWLMRGCFCTLSTMRCRFCRFRHLPAFRAVQAAIFLYFNTCSDVWASHQFASVDRLARLIKIVDVSFNLIRKIFVWILQFA